MKATDICVESVEVTFDDERLSVPLHLSKGVIEAITYAAVTVRANTRGGAVVQGTGAILLSDVWAFPAPALDHEEKDRLMRRLCQAIAVWLRDDQYEDPIEKGFRLEEAAIKLAVQLAEEEPLLQSTPMPRLAVLNCMAPFDAAIHDAWGTALPAPLYAAYNADHLNQDLSASLGADFAGRYPADYLGPRRRGLFVQHVVGFNDALTPGEVDRQQPAPAGLPADLTSWIERDRLRYFKLKLRGQSPAEDAARLIEVHAAASQAMEAAGIAGGPRLSADPNEAYQEAALMLDVLDRVDAENPQALAALDYIEQPTPRDLGAYTDTLHDVAARVPVVVDESLDDLANLDWIHRLGWSGLAVKTCKGHTHSLLAYCWGRHHSLYLTLQDLTNPGLALVHSVNFCAHLRLDVDCFEGNYRQFMPLSRPHEQAAHPAYFQVSDGQLILPPEMGAGLY
jgi:L-alanine-DL-glutamate epimerase-like enolase superfamily enzyme